MGQRNGGGKERKRSRGREKGEDGREKGEDGREEGEEAGVKVRGFTGVRRTLKRFRGGTIIPLGDGL